VADLDVHTVRSFCRICTTLCGIRVDVSGGQVLRVRGDRDHPFTRGYTCAKGRSLPRMHHHPDRLERPLWRVGDRLVPASWDECLDDLADRLRAILERHGPSAIAVLFGSGLGMDAAGYRMAETLHAAIGRPPRFSPLTIDGTAKALMAWQIGGFPGLSAHVDYAHARLVILLGSNPIVSHGHNNGLTPSTLRTLRKRAELWVVDPRRTETARLATRHLAPRPGTDYAVLAYLVRELLRDGADREALAHRAVGVDALADAVDPFALAHAACVADVREADLLDLLAAVRRAGRVAVETGTGITMSASANVAQWLAWALAIVTGSMNRPGGIWFHPGFHRRYESFEIPVVPPDALFGAGPRSRPEAQSFLGEWPCAALADEIRAGHIRALLNLGGHLVAAFPDTNALVPALRSLDVFATIEIIGNETTALSTHVMPTKDQLERADVTLWDTLVPRVAVQHTPAVVEPVGERRSTWWVLAELGRRLGHELLEPRGERATDDAMLARVMAGSRCALEEVAAAGWVERSHELPAPWVERHLDRLGGWRLAPPLLVDQLAALAPAAGPLVFVPRRQARRLNSQLGYLGELPEVVIHPDDADAAAVADGCAVLVRSGRGELVGVAKVDPSIRPGVVSIPHGHERANVNRLTDKDQIDAVTGMVQYSGIPVTLHPCASAST
jgi:anaerobic selenocysteine-containing dehydrogenase